MIEISLHDPVQAHKAFAKVWNDCKALLMAGRKQVLKLEDFQETLTAKQRKYYHGFILTEIAKQARIDGKHYPMNVWKEHFRATYLGDKVVTELNPMTGVETKRTVRVSTEDLKVKGYNLLIEQVTAFAATELNVIFDKDFNTWLEENDH